MGLAIMSTQKKARAFVITNPMTPLNKSGEVTTSKFIRTIQNSYEKVSLIGGNVSLEQDITDVDIETYTYQKKGNKLKKLFGMLRLQHNVSLFIRKNVSYGDHIIFWLGDKMLLPFFTARRATDHLGYFVYGNLATEGNNSLFMRASAKLVMYMANKADRVFVESRAVKGGWNGQIKKDVHELHLYTDMIAFSPIKNRQNKIGMLCRLAGVKHVLESIQAFCQVHEKHPGWKLEMIGSGVQEEECRTLVDDLGAGDFVKLYGWVDHDTVAKITDEWKYNMLASDHEGLPNSMIEMMGKGVPIIATPVGGIPDLLKDGENGFRLKGTTVEDIKEGLSRAITAENYEQMSTDAFETVSKKFSLDGARKKAAETLLNW